MTEPFAADAAAARARDLEHPMSVYDAMQLYSGTTQPPPSDRIRVLADAGEIGPTYLTDAGTLATQNAGQFLASLDHWMRQANGGAGYRRQGGGGRQRIPDGKVAILPYLRDNVAADQGVKAGLWSATRSRGKPPMLAHEIRSDFSLGAAGAEKFGGTWIAAPADVDEWLWRLSCRNGHEIDLRRNPTLSGDG